MTEKRAHHDRMVETSEKVGFMVPAEYKAEDIRIPDGFTPVIGFRRFGIPWPPHSKENTHLVQRGHEWATNAPTTAKCKVPDATACGKASPSHDCVCGLYAWLNIEEALSYHEITTTMGWVLASVIGWGKVLFDESFWRAEKAQVIAFADPRDTHASKPEIVRERTGKWLARTAVNYEVPILPLDDLREHTLLYGDEWVEIG